MATQNSFPNVSIPAQNPLAIIDQIKALLSTASNTDDAASSRSQKIHTVQSLLETVDFGQQKPQILELLAEACYDQWMAVNEFAALEDAVDYYGELIEDSDGDDLVYSARLCEGYARCMQQRFMRGRNELDLEQAINFASDSIERTKKTPDFDLSLLIKRIGTLWLCLFTKVNQLDDSTPDEFERMMETAKEAETMAKVHNFNNAILIEAKSNLGMAYQIKWDQQRNFDALVKSLNLGHETLDSLLEDSSTQSQIDALSNLSFRLQRAYWCYVVENKVPPSMKQSEGRKLLDEALECLGKSVTLRGERLLSGPENTLTFVMYIREFPLEHRGYILGNCLEVLRSSIKSIRDFCKISSPEDQKDCISTCYGISRYAAASSLKAGETPYQALVLLEEGRTILASLREQITDVDSIRSYDKDLANEYSQVLDAFKVSFTNRTSFHERKLNVQRLSEIQEKLWQIPGLPQSLEQISETQMTELAEDKDIVVVNVTDIVSDAIIITKTGFRVVHLPDLDEYQLSEDSWEIQTRLTKEENQEEVFHDLHTNLSNLLRDLWKNLAKPILEDLGYTQTLSKSDKWPRITWIPTGILCLYPIHAAGLGLHKKSNAMNRVISSYSPSLSTLFRLRQHEKEKTTERQPVGSTKTIIISMPETADRQPLNLSTEEATTITQIFTDSNILTNQTTEDILAAIAKNPQIIHFSCHGEVDYDQPLLSKLLTTDWQTSPLTVAQLQVLNLEECRLAFLSACFTANAGVENMQDESDHVAGALHLAGVSNVVGSSWYVGESPAFEVVKRFYQELAKGRGRWSEDVAKALHFAVMDFRETTRTAGNKMRGDPISWAPFLHFG